MNQKSIKIRLFVLCQSTTPSHEACPEAWSPIRLHWRKLILPLPVVINFNFLLDQGRDTMSTSPFQCGTPSGFKLCRSCLNFHSISEIICICANRAWKTLFLEASIKFGFLSSIPTVLQTVCKTHLHCILCQVRDHWENSSGKTGIRATVMLVLNFSITREREHHLWVFLR